RIPAVVRQVEDRDQLELALVENLQREDLNPIEAAHAFRQLIDEFGFTPEQISARISRARSTVANTLRLLSLDPTVQDAVAGELITEGHARALGSLPPAAQVRLLETVLARDLSVRQTEELARRLRDGSAPSTSQLAQPAPARGDELE